MSSNRKTKKYPINLQIHTTGFSNSNSKKEPSSTTKFRTAIERSKSNSSNHSRINKELDSNKETEKAVSSFIESLFDDYYSIDDNKHSKSIIKKKNPEKFYNKNKGINLSKYTNTRNKKNENKSNNSLKKKLLKNSSSTKNNKMNKTAEDIKHNLEFDEINITGDYKIKIEKSKINMKKKICEDKLRKVNQQISWLKKQKNELKKELSLLKMEENELNLKSKEKIKTKEETKDNNRNRINSFKNEEEDEEEKKNEEIKEKEEGNNKGDDAEELIKFFNINAEKNEEALYPFAEKNNKVSQNKIYENQIRKMTPKKNNYKRKIVINNRNSNERTISNARCTTNGHRKKIKTITSNEIYNKNKKFKK